MNNKPNNSYDISQNALVISFFYKNVQFYDAFIIVIYKPVTVYIMCCKNMIY